MTNEQQWIDILPLAPPETSWFGNELGWLMLGIVIVSISFFYWYRRPLQRASRQLNRLAKQASYTESNAKQILFEITRTLQYGIGCNNLRTIKLPAAQQAEWQTFIDTLTTHKYQANTPDTSHLNQLLTQARYWLHTVSDDRG